MSLSSRVLLDTELDRRIHRPPARALATLLSKTKITPNHVTVFSLVPAFLSALCFWRGNLYQGALALFFYYLWSVLDHADGELARLTGQSTDFGKRLDDFCDNVATILIFLGLFFGLLPSWNEKDQNLFKILFFTGLFLNTLGCLAALKAKIKIHTDPISNVRLIGFKRFLDHFTGRDVIYFLIFLVLVSFRWRWPWATVSMGILIIGLYAVSSTCFVFWAKTLSSPHPPKDGSTDDLMAERRGSTLSL